MITVPPRNQIFPANKRTINSRFEFMPTIVSKEKALSKLETHFKTLSVTEQNLLISTLREFKQELESEIKIINNASQDKFIISLITTSGIIKAILLYSLIPSTLAFFFPAGMLAALKPVWNYHAQVSTSQDLETLLKQNKIEPEVSKIIISQNEWHKSLTARLDFCNTAIKKLEPLYEKIK